MRDVGGQVRASRGRQKGVRFVRYDGVKDNKVGNQRRVRRSQKVIRCVRCDGVEGS